MTRGHGAAREVQGQLREGARRQARLHVVLRQGVRRGARSCSPASTPRCVGGNIVYKKHYDFGIAVVGAEGPRRAGAARRATQLSFAGIEKGIAELAEQGAQPASSTLDDLQGGTFSITNGGIYGSMMSTPLLNYPQTGILGMHNIVKRADRRRRRRSRCAR